MRVSTRIIAGYALILSLFVIVTYVNFRLAERVKDNTEFLNRSESVIRISAQLQRSIIDMENGFRGFLLTGNTTFLTFYYSANAEVPGYFKELEPLLNSPFQREKLDSINWLYTRWRASFADPMIDARKAAAFSKLADLNYDKLFSAEMKTEVGKNLTDLIRFKFKQFNQYEYDLRHSRRTALNFVVKQTTWLSLSLVAISLLLGVISAVIITRIISRRIAEMVRAAEKIASGDLSTKVDERSNDELASLGHSLNIMSEKLSVTIGDLEKKNADLNQFAYVVSHDLKAPLRGIENVLKWINEDASEQLPQQVAGYLDMIKGRTKRMENLINGLLELSRIGRTKKPMEAVNVEELISEVIENLAPPRNFRIFTECQMPNIYTERIYLAQVFSNLISNAIKYNDKERGEVRISCEENEDQYVFRVSDNGPGIEKEYHEKIFMIFQTLTEKDAFESTGVGLAIVRRIIDEKGGKITVDSTPGAGSTFSFSWPKESDTETILKSEAETSVV